jgi:hypothetical protein
MDFKKIKKIVAGSVAGALIVSATACTPISTKAQWSYKYGDYEKAVGVYIFALYNAYNEAQTYAEDVDGYDENESFLDLKITDDEGNEAVASQWIKDRADIIVREALYLDNALDEKNSTVDEESYSSQAQQDWELGYNYALYSQYGYSTTPEQDILEPYGISVDSYCQLQYIANAKRSQLFDLMYDEGGSEEVSDKELKKYFDESYSYYSYFTIPLYEDTTDDDGNQTSEAYSTKKQKKLTKLAESYANAINNGSTVNKQCKEYLDYTKSDAEVSDTVTTNCELLDEDNLSSSTLGEDVATDFVDIKVGEAKAITIGEDDSKTIYVIQKLNPVKAESEYLTKDDSTRKSVLQNMKSDDFTAFLEKEAKALKCEVNSSTIDRYDPDMFWEEPEEETTTTANS